MKSHYTASPNNIPPGKLIQAISGRSRPSSPHEGSVTAPVFKEFLKRLMVGATKPIYIVVDGHSIQKTKLVRD